MLAVSQLNAQVKLLEVWKALNVPKYLLTIKQQGANHEGVSTRANKKERPCEIGMSLLTQRTCISDAIRLWNMAQEKISQCNSLYQIKKEIKTFVKYLPI